MGRAVGNSLEVAEAIDTLKCSGPADLAELCVELCARILTMSGRMDDVNQARARRCGHWNRARRWRSSKRSWPHRMETPRSSRGRLCSVLPFTRVEAASEESGWVDSIDCLRIGLAACMLGAGRQCIEDEIDLTVGLTVNKKLGDRLERGDTLAVIHANDPARAAVARDMVVESYHVAKARVEPPALIREFVEA